FLVEGRPSSMAGLSKLNVRELADWSKLPEVVKTGQPADLTFETANNPFWEELVPAIAPLSFPSAQAVAQRLGIANAGPVRLLDVGGGSGVFSAVLLGANREARATQLDWSNVNAIARRFVDGFGVGDRFETRDGDLNAADYGTGYDV